MAWAVTATDRKATYIGSLRRDQTGLACDCICPACGGRLQAVNAGKSLQDLPAGKSLRPHFRHDSGQQQNSCLVRMSQIVTLQLLMQEKVIHLPAQTSSWTTGGASGQIYTGTASYPGFSARIAERQWVDEHEAKITLEDGRVVWLRLFGGYGRGLESSGDAIISIKVDDPEVSTWTAEKILEHAQLTGQWLCWEKHFQDDELAMQARLDAENQAQHWCDHIPPDMDLPEGLTHAQRSESVLHWLIKGILENAEFITTPEYSDTITRYMPDQSSLSRRVYLERRVYAIGNVRLEHRLQGVIPDVICTASQGQDSLELMIEVAVTHKVDASKLDRIRGLGLACLEIDTKRMGQTGRTTVDELRAMVLDHTRNKNWIYHPAIDLRTRMAEEYLGRAYSERAKALAEERARTGWLQTLNDEELLQEYFGLLRQVWTDQSPTDSQGRACQPADVVTWLLERKFRGMDQSAITAPRGLLWMLDVIINKTTNESSVTLLEEAMNGSGPEHLKSYVTVIGAAIKIYAPPSTLVEIDRLERLRTTIKESLHQGESTYARTTQYDKALSILFPGLKAPLESKKGTQDVADRVRFQIHSKRREQEQKAAEELQRAQAIKAHQEDLRTRYDEIARYYDWLPIKGWPHDLATTEMEVKQSIGRGGIVRDMPWKEVLASAWQARDEKISLTTWMQSQGVDDFHDIDARLRLLEVAWMLGKQKLQRR